MDKYFAVREWKNFDNGGMDFYIFNSVEELQDWLLTQYPEGIEKKKDQLKTIRGTMLNIVTKETKIVKNYAISQT